jgi:hypothetical protein
MKIIHGIERTGIERFDVIRACVMTVNEVHVV